MLEVPSNKLRIKHLRKRALGPVAGTAVHHSQLQIIVIAQLTLEAEYLRKTKRIYMKSARNYRFALTSHSELPAPLTDASFATPCW